jgi:hypothetical protein
MANSNPKITLGGERSRLVYSPVIPYQTETMQRFNFFSYKNYSIDILAIFDLHDLEYYYLEYNSQFSYNVRKSVFNDTFKIYFEVG